jgi:hypothetical protein
MEFTFRQLRRDDRDRIWNFVRYIWKPRGAANNARRSQAAAKIGVDAKWTQGKFSALFRWCHDIQACDGVSLCQITSYLLIIKIENASKVCTGAKKV